MESTEHLSYTREGATAIVTMNRPEAKNALSLPMLVGMADAWEEINDNDDIRCAILTGAGGNFCTGMDLKSIGASPENDKYQARREADPDLHWKALLRHYEVKKPLIAAVEGWAVAGGTEILQATDIRVAGAGAIFGVFEAKRGLFPLGGSTVRLRRQIRYTVAMDLLLTAREVPAEEALRIGLIGYVVPDGTALEKALEIAAVIGQNGPLAVEAIKRSVRETEGMSEVDGLARELEIGWPIFSTKDRRGTQGVRREETGALHPPVSHPPPLPGNDFPGMDGPPNSTGDQPLNRLADAVRRISAAAVGHAVPDADIAEAADRLVRIADELEGSAPESKRPRFQPAGHPQDYFPMSPMIGFANPIAPPVEVWSVQGESGRREIRGRVTFGDAYEGPPGCVHGGIIAAVFDEVMGAANIITENPGMTGTLTVRYRRPTPLLAPLDMVARLTGTERRKIFTWAGIYHDGALTAEAEGIFVKMDPDRLLEVANAGTRAADDHAIEQDFAHLIAKNAGS